MWKQDCYCENQSNAYSLERKTKMQDVILMLCKWIMKVLGTKVVSKSKCATQSLQHSSLYLWNHLPSEINLFHNDYLWWHIWLINRFDLKVQAQWLLYSPVERCFILRCPEGRVWQTWSESCQTERRGRFQGYSHGMPPSRKPKKKAGGRGGWHPCNKPPEQLR